MNDAYLAELRHLGVMPANVKQILTHGPEFLAFDEQSGSWKDVLAKVCFFFNWLHVIDWLVGWLVGRLVGWLVGRSIAGKHSDSLLPGDSYCSLGQCLGWWASGESGCR